MSCTIPPTVCEKKKKDSKLASVEDNDDTVLQHYGLPVAGSKTRAIVILRLRVHVGVPFGACIIQAVVESLRRLTNERKSTRFTPTSSHIKSLQPCNESRGQACRCVSQTERIVTCFSTISMTGDRFRSVSMKHGGLTRLQSFKISQETAA